MFINGNLIVVLYSKFEWKCWQEFQKWFSCRVCSPFLTLIMIQFSSERVRKNDTKNDFRNVFVIFFVWLELLKFEHLFPNDNQQSYKNLSERSMSHRTLVIAFIVSATKQTSFNTLAINQETCWPPEMNTGKHEIVALMASLPMVSWNFMFANLRWNILQASYSPKGFSNIYIFTKQ